MDGPSVVWELWTDDSRAFDKQGADALALVVPASPERTRLAAAAPDMARALLELEWSRDAVCCGCGGARATGYLAGCVIHTALRTAGLR